MEQRAIFPLTVASPPSKGLQWETSCSYHAQDIALSTITLFNAACSPHKRGFNERISKWKVYCNQFITPESHWTCSVKYVTRIQRWIFFLQLCHFMVFYFPDLYSSCTTTSAFQLPQKPDSPLHWKASLRLSNTSANPRTSFTRCITYSGSTPGAPTRWDVSPMLLRGFGLLELRPISQVLVDPADRDPMWGLEICPGRPWVFSVPLPPLLLLFRSIPIATPAATLYQGDSRPASLWI